MTERRRYLFYLSSMVVGLSLVFFLFELTFRLYGLNTINYKDNKKQSYYFWISDERLGFRNGSNKSYLDVSLKLKPIVTTDNHGFRNGFGWSDAGKSPIILMLGDSTTFCGEVNDENTGPSELAKLLCSDTKIRVLNAGVRGYNTIQSKRMLEECINRFPDQIKVVVYVFCDNDYLENLFRLYDPVLAPVARWNKQQGAIEYIEVNPDVPRGQPFKERLDFRQRFSTYVRSKSVVLHHSLYTLSLIKHVYGLKLLMGEARKKFGDEILEESIRQMNEICKANGILFVSTSFWTGIKIFGIDCNNYPDICAKAGVCYVNLKDYFIDQSVSYTAEKSDGTYDPHYGLKGTRTFASGLSHFLKKPSNLGFCAEETKNISNLLSTFSTLDSTSPHANSKE